MCLDIRKLRTRVRILYVHERLGSLGGAEANVLITAREFAARGHEVGLLHGPPTGRGEANWRQVFANRYQLDDSPRATVEHALANFEPDVVYVHKTADLRVLDTLAESHHAVVRMVHDHDIYCMRSYKYSYVTRKICTRAASLYCVFGCGAFLTRRQGPGFPLQYNSYSEKRREIEINQRFDRMIVVTEFMKEELLRNGFDGRKIVVHGPIPPPPRDPHLRSNFSDRNLIIYAGQIIRGKGVDVLLRSLARVTVPFECIILGDGNHKAYCERLASELGLTDRVKFKGFVPQEELNDYYREASVVAISSVWPEPIATIGLEVMRYALPVVAFDAGGIKEWLIDGYNGFLVPWMDETTYARSLERVLVDPDLARGMGENGLKLVTERFDFSTYIQDLETLFESLPEQHEQHSAAAIA